MKAPSIVAKHRQSSDTRMYTLHPYQTVVETMFINHAYTPRQYRPAFATHADTDDLLHDMLAPNMEERMLQFV
jgi:hypothetical protein